MIKDSDSVDEKTVSVVIPSHQRHKEVIRAVKSALSQTLSPMEVIVSNDGPDPEKARLLAALDDERIRFVEAPRRGNASTTRNFGIRHATGDWVALLDDDDVWLPNKLDIQFSKLNAEKVGVAIMGGVEAIHADSGETWTRPRIIPEGLTEASFFVLSPEGGVNTSTIVAPRNLFIKYPFNEENDNLLEDVEWILQAGTEFKILVPDEIVVVRYLNNNSGLGSPGRIDEAWRWYERTKFLMSENAKVYVLTTMLAKRAGHKFSLRHFWNLLKELKSIKSSQFSDYIRLSVYFFVPARVGHRVKRLFYNR